MRVKSSNSCVDSMLGALLRIGVREIRMDQSTEFFPLSACPVDVLVYAPFRMLSAGDFKTPLR